MSRTKRRGYNHLTRKHSDRKERPDWSCGNPHCCGGKVKTKERRSLRAKAAQWLRRDPESMSTRPTKGDRI